MGTRPVRVCIIGDAQCRSKDTCSSPVTVVRVPLISVLECAGQLRRPDASRLNESRLTGNGHYFRMTQSGNAA